MKNKRTLILISGILFLLAAITYIVLAVALPLLTEIKLIPALPAEYDLMVEAGEISAIDVAEAVAAETMLLRLFVYVFAGCMVLSAIADIVLGSLLIVHSRKSNEVVATKKGLIITSLVFSFFTCGLIVSVLLILALCQKVDPSEIETNVNQNVQGEEVVVEESVDGLSVDEVALETRIKKLQTLRDNGSITQDEYIELLKRIFKE